MRIVLAILTGLAANEAWACDDYSSRTVIGFSAGGTAVVSRVAGEEPGEAWVRIETHQLPALKLLQKWDILSREELEKRPPKDSVAKLRAKRWKDVEAELTAKGFVIQPNRELPSRGQGTERTFQLEGAELGTTKAADDNDVCAYDLVLRGKVVLKHAVTGCSAMGANWFERAYLVPGGKHAILVHRGACTDPALVVIPVGTRG